MTDNYMLPDDIKAMLACPLCKKSLKEEAEQLSCSACKTVYPVINGVPHLMAGQYQVDLSISKTNEYKSDILNSQLFKRARYIFGSDYVPHQPLQNFAGLFTDKAKYGGRVLNLGSGSGIKQKGVINVDAEQLPNVDIVADGCQLPFADEVFDAVISETVIEHVKYPAKFTAEMERVLKPSGAVYITAPFLHPFHGYPSDYQRYSTEGIKVLFGNFTEVETGIYRGPSVALVHILSDYATLFSFTDNRTVYYLIKAIFTLCLFPIKFLDIILLKSKNAYTLASCIYYIGKKK